MSPFVFAAAAGLLVACQTIDPVPPSSEVRFTDLALGRNHTCAIADDGTAYCWGEASLGALGDGHAADSSCRSNGFTSKCRATPRAVATTARFRMIDAQLHNTCALDLANDLWCWGAGTGVLASRHDSATVPVRIHHGTTFSAISVGGGFACGITLTDQRLLCWGENSRGQLGIGDRTPRDAPVHVDLGAPPSRVSAGDSHVCAIASGSLYCWGNNDTGQLGLGVADTNRSTPSLISGAGVWYEVVAGGTRTCGIRGQAPEVTLCWGGTRVATDSLNSRSPVQVGVNGLRSLAVGTELSCLVELGMTARCWGRDAQLIGAGNGLYNEIATPRPLAVQRTFLEVEVGLYHGCAIDDQQRLWCWGLAHQGQLTLTEFPEVCTRSDEFYRCTGVPVAARPPE